MAGCQQNENARYIFLRIPFMESTYKLRANKVKQNKGFAKLTPPSPSNTYKNNIV